MAHQAARKLPLRHPAEIPMFVFMVVLNFLILAVLIDFLASAALIPPALRGNNWEAAWRAVAGAIIFVAPALLIIRQVQRASSWPVISASGRFAVQLSSSHARGFKGHRFRVRNPWCA